LIERRPIGRTGLVGSSLGLGTAALGMSYGAPRAERRPPAEAEAEATIEAALDAGIRMIDTAPAYGTSEVLVGRVTGGADDCIIATKLATPGPGWDALDANAVADAVRRSAQASLRALRRDAIDLLQIHNATATGLEHGGGPAALAELRRDGVIRAAGATTYGEAAALAAVACEALDVVQVAFSPLDRRPAERVLAAAAAAGTAVITRSALLRGVLSARGRELDGPFAPLRDAADAFRVAVGARWDELPSAAVAYCLAQPGIATTVLGPRDAGELRELLTGVTRFAAAAARAAGWERELPDALLDPSRWPALETA